MGVRLDRLRTEQHPGDWKATVLKAEVWVDTVAEGGRRFMAAWRKEEVDVARHRQEKREATTLGKLLLRTEAKALPDFFGFFFPRSDDHERDWPPCKVVFRVGNQYAECEKQGYYH